MQDLEYILMDIEDGIWTSRDGTRRWIKEMTKEHVINCLNTFSEETKRGKALREYLARECPNIKIIYAESP